MTPMKAATLNPDEMEAWFAGKIPRRLLAIPFSGPINGKDLDREYFDARTDIKPEWFTERPIDWHHSQSPDGLMNGALIGKASNLGAFDGTPGEPDEEGWWVDTWLNHGERRLRLIKALQDRGGQLFGSSYAYPPLIKRGKAGHIDVWPYMVQTLSTSPQNTHSVIRTGKAVLEDFDQAEIAVLPALRDVLTALDSLRDLSPDLESDGTAKAGRELSGANLAELDEWLELLTTVSKRAASLRDRVRTKYESQSRGD